MKLKFKNFFAINCIPNMGVQYFKISDVPFKIGDYVKFTSAGKRHFDEIPDAISRITGMEYNKVPGVGNNNVIIMIDTHNETLCCSWVVPLNSGRKLL